MLPPSSREFQGNKSCRGTYHSPIIDTRATIPNNRLTFVEGAEYSLLHLVRAGLKELLGGLFPGSAHQVKPLLPVSFTSKVLPVGSSRSCGTSELFTLFKFQHLNQPLSRLIAGISNPSVCLVRTYPLKRRCPPASGRARGHRHWIDCTSTTVCHTH